jgi:predicted RNA-binding Zn-ribbon protein involved in translation (DUF1610 family)
MVLSQEQKRIEMGWQCPECSSVKVIGRYNRLQAKPEGFECQNCGCNWSPKIKVKND